jgi:hypothetical protein
MPLPTCTWEQRAIYSTGGSTTVLGFLTALKNYLALPLVPGWYVEVLTDGLANDGGKSPYLELKFTQPLGDREFHLLLAGTDAGAATTNVHDDQTFDDGQAHRYKLSKATGQLYVGYAPNGRVAGLADPFGAASPYGVDEWSKFYRLSHNMNIDSIWMIDCEEMAWLLFETSTGTIRGIEFGAIVRPLTDAAGYYLDGEDVGRTPGMFSIGMNDGGMQTSFRSNNSDRRVMLHMVCNNSSTQDRAPFSSLMSVNVADQVGFAAVWGAQVTGSSDTADSWKPGTLRDRLGNLATPEIVVCLRSTGSSPPSLTECFGTLRQVYDCENAVCRQEFQDEESEVLGYAIAPSRTSVQCAIMAGNS